ncbi:MAG: hemolysin family protein [Bacteroidales bacterium]
MEPPSSTLDDYYSQGISLILSLLVYALITALSYSYRHIKESQLAAKIQETKSGSRVNALLSDPQGFSGMISLFSILSKLLAVFAVIHLPLSPFYSVPIAVLTIIVTNRVVVISISSREESSLRLFSGFALFLMAISNPVNRLFKRYSTIIEEKRDTKEAQAIEDITDIDEHSDAGEAEEKRLLKSIAGLSNTSVSSIMKPRVEVFALESGMSSEEVLMKTVECGYSRLPVYEGSLDNIKGFLYVKDLIGYIKDGVRDFMWHKHIRKAYFVPGTKKIDDLLEEFRQKKIHLAMVVDEYGGTDGIVTLEDVLEEIVGEIWDETD